MTADQRAMWLTWARSLDTLGAGPRPVSHPPVTSQPVRVPSLPRE